MDTLKLLNRAFHNEAPEYFVVPEEPEVIASLIEFAESDPSGLSGDFLSSDHRYARIVARTHLFSSSELHTTIDRINQQAAQLFPADFKVQVSGSLVLMNQTSDRVAAEQAKSLIFSVLLISAIVVILFRSFKIACLAIDPGRVAGSSLFRTHGLVRRFSECQHQPDRKCRNRNCREQLRSLPGPFSEKRAQWAFNRRCHA